MTPSRSQRDVKRSVKQGYGVKNGHASTSQILLRFHSVVLFQASASAGHSQVFLELIKVSWIRQLCIVFLWRGEPLRAKAPANISWSSLKTSARTALMLKGSFFFPLLRPMSLWGSVLTLGSAGKRIKKLSMKHSGLIRKRASSQTNTTTTKQPLMLKGSNTSGSSFIMRTHPRTDIDLRSKTLAKQLFYWLFSFMIFLWIFMIFRIWFEKNGEKWIWFFMIFFFFNFMIFLYFFMIFLWFCLWFFYDFFCFFTCFYVFFMIFYNSLKMIFFNEILWYFYENLWFFMKNMIFYDFFYGFFKKKYGFLYFEESYDFLMFFSNFYLIF